MLFKEIHELYRFFWKTPEEEKAIIFYSEHEGYYPNFEGLIEELIDGHKQKLCYVTSDPDDPILKTSQPLINTFYINKLLVLFMSYVNCKVFVMTLTDLNQFHLRRSANPVHYVYVFHALVSTHMMHLFGAFDHYDTIFCVGPHHVNEIKATEKLYELKPKKIINYGFGRLDTLLQEKEKFEKSDSNLKDLILITPSYGSENLLEKCGIELIDTLLKSNFRVLLRPHFRTLRDSKELIDSIRDKFGKNPNFTFKDGIIPSEYFHNSICMVSDWSGISMEYAFTFERPIIFIDVPKKVLNPNSSDILLEPIEISLRSKLGYIVSPNNLKIIPDLVKNMNKNNKFSQQIRKMRSETVFNIGESAKIGADFIQQLIKSN